MLSRLSGQHTRHIQELQERTERLRVNLDSVNEEVVAAREAVEASNRESARTGAELRTAITRRDQLLRRAIASEAGPKAERLLSLDLAISELEQASSVFLPTTSILAYLSNNLLPLVNSRSASRLAGVDTLPAGFPVPAELPSLGHALVSGWDSVAALIIDLRRQISTLEISEDPQVAVRVAAQAQTALAMLTAAQESVNQLRSAYKSEREQLLRSARIRSRAPQTTSRQASQVRSNPR